jgi:hypothetical protein
MKSAIQGFIVVAVIGGGIFLVTFLSQNTRKPAATAPTTSGPVTGTEIVHAYEKTAVWDDKDPGYVQEVEKNTPGYYDFLLSNANDRPVTLTLELKSCKCANVRFGVLTGANRAKVKGAANPPTGPRLAPYVGDLQWTDMLHDRDKPPVPVTVPAADADGPQFAVVRLGWEPKEPQSTRLTAQIQARLGSAADYLQFDLPVIIAPILVTSQDQLQFGDINPGDRRAQSFVVWSSTRADVPVKARLTTDDPCIEVAEPRPVVGEELKKLPEELAAAAEVKSKTRPKCAYAVTVTVSESRGDHQLELGPLARRLVINRGTDSEATVLLTGTVRGAIQVGEPADHDRIDLRVFPANRGTQKMVVVKSSLPGLALTVDHVRPAELQATIVAGPPGFGTRQWKLTVTAPGDDKLSGPLPPDSAIYLKTNSTPPRRIRIPVMGNASG